MKLLQVITLSFVCSVFAIKADVSRFIEPLVVKPKNFIPGKIFHAKPKASIAPSDLNRRVHTDTFSFNTETYELLLSRETIEKKLSELLSHRYQVSGDVVVYLTRQWNPLKVSSNFIIKIRDCMPDQLSASSFVRFSIWDKGLKVADCAEPIRLTHFIEVYCTKNLLQRGSKLNSSYLGNRSVDILKQHIGAVPVGTNLKGYELSANLRDNSVLKWNHLRKVALVKKGEVVDVFASGTGIYISMKGMALENGVEGGFVKVRNLSSDKEFQAKVLNEKSVKVQL